MKIVVDWDPCQGHANCMGDAPEVFRVDDQGMVTILLEEPPEAMRQLVELAARYCPTQAIRIED